VQLLGENLGDRLAPGLTAQGDGLFEGLQASRARRTLRQMGFDFPALRLIDFLVNVFG
jgi:hypothetical protein